MMELMAVVDDLRQTVAMLTTKVDQLLENANTPAPRFLSIEAAAARIGVSRVSIQRLLAQRLLTPYRPIRGRVVLDVDQLDRFVRACGKSIRRGRGRSPGSRNGGRRKESTDVSLSTAQE